MWYSDYMGYTETLEEAEQVMLEYEIVTGSKYVVGYKRATFGRSFLGKIVMKATGDLHRFCFVFNYLDKVTLLVLWRNVHPWNIFCSTWIFFVIGCQ